MDVRSVMLTLFGVAGIFLLCLLSYNLGQINLYRDLDNHGCERVLELHKAGKV